MQSRIAVIGVVLFAILLTIFTFTQQQQAARNEATAVANARAAGTSQFQADVARETAVVQADSAATAQANAVLAAATAVAQANNQATAQDRAEHIGSTAVAQAATAVSAQADAEQAEASAIARADTQGTSQAEAEAEQATAVGVADAAMTAQTMAEATRAAAVKTAQAGATEAGEQAATALVAQGEAMTQAALAQMVVSAATESAATAAANLQQARATVFAMQNRISGIRGTATAQYRSDKETLDQALATVQAPLTPVARINQSPEETMRFLVEQETIAGFGGHVTAQLETNIDLTGRDNWVEWNEFVGTYTDFVVSADVYWGGGAPNDQCGFLVRIQDDNNFHEIVFDYYSYLGFHTKEDGEWKQYFPFRQSTAIRTGPDDANHLVVVAIKDEFTVYINGQRAGVYIERRFPTGTAAVTATTFESSNSAGCTFVNTWIWSLERDSPTVTPLPPTTLPPTPVPAAAVGTPYPVPQLTQTFRYSDGSYSLQYPARWIADELSDGSMTLSSSPQAALMVSGTISGEIFITASAFSNKETDGMSLNSLAGQAITTFKELLSTDERIVFTNPETFQLAGYEAIKTIGTNDSYDLEIVIYKKEESIIFLFAFCGRGEIALCEPTVHAIAETVVYYPDASQT